RCRCGLRPGRLRRTSLRCDGAPYRVCSMRSPGSRAQPRRLGKEKSTGTLALWAPADQGVSGRAWCASRAVRRERGKEGGAFARRKCPFGKLGEPLRGSDRRRERLRGKPEGGGTVVRGCHVLLLAPSGSNVRRAASEAEALRAAGRLRIGARTASRCGLRYTTTVTHFPL